VLTQIKVRTFGEFSICSGNVCISDRDNRSRKVWLLLAYLLCHRNRVVLPNELIDLLYGEEPKGTNPSSALKTTLHRARGQLDRLWPGAGHELLCSRDGGYRWNTDHPVSIDMEEFDRLCQDPSGDEDALLARRMSALSLYQGNFLDKLSSEPWVLPLAAYFHNQAIHITQQAVPVLVAKKRFQEAEDICRRAIIAEPYHEGLHAQLMRLLLAQNRQKEVVALYENLSQQLFDEFGIMPGEEILSLYRESVRAVNSRALPMDTILTHLKEPASLSGALVCEYDYFVVLCRSEARSLARDGKAAHIALLSVTGADNDELPKRSLDRTMDNLEEQIRTGLRRGDALTRCSASQFLIMLPHANYENSCMVCRRIISGFSRRYPHSPAKLRFTVQPLEPNL